MSSEPSPINRDKIDRYGFYQKVNSLAKSKKEEEIERVEFEKERSREKKWIEMTTNWQYWIKNKRSVIARRIIKGVPDSIRSKVWLKLTNVEELKKNAENPYEYYLHLPEIDDYNIIRRDINRTFPQVQVFSRPEFLQSLERVLQATSQKSSSVGYTQGMADLGGLFLMYMSEEDAFWLFVQLMFDPRWDMHNLFVDGFPRVVECCHVQTLLLKKFFPGLLKHMQTICFDPTVINGAAMEWYMTLFSRVIPFRYVVRVFDFVLYKGFSSIFQFAMAFFHLLIPKLMVTEDPNVLSETIKNVSAVLEKTNPADLVALAIKYKSASSLADRYIADYRKKNGGGLLLPPGVAAPPSPNRE